MGLLFTAANRSAGGGGDNSGVVTKLSVSDFRTVLSLVVSMTISC